MRGSSHILGAPGLVSNTGNAKEAAGTKGGLWEAWIPLAGAQGREERWTEYCSSGCPLPKTNSVWDTA